MKSESHASRVAHSLAKPILRAALTTLGAIMAPSMASAQGYMVPDKLLFDPLGVELGSFAYARNDELLKIGGDGHLGLSWMYPSHAQNDNYRGSIVYFGPPETSAMEVRVLLSGAVTKFAQCADGACLNASGTGATLVQTSSNWIYSAADGTVYTFNKTGNMSDYSSQYSPGVSLGELQTIRYTDGTTLTINYGSGSGLPAIASVVSNRGYGLKYDYGSGTSQISAVNLSRHVCDATLSTCDGVDAVVSVAGGSVTSGVGQQTTFNATLVTDPSGRVWTYRRLAIPVWWDNPSNPGPPATAYRDGLWYFKSPEGLEVAVTYDVTGRMTTFADNRGTFSFTYPDETLQMAKLGNSSHTIVETAPNGSLFFKSDGDSWVEDPLAHRRTIEYEGGVVWSSIDNIDWHRIKALSQPEGDKKTWTFDARGNISVQTEASKSGSTTLQGTATYTSGCSNQITCNRPTSVTDARGNATNYAYDPVHGGVLSEMGPAPTSGAARPLKLYTYGQKYAYVKNSGGSLVQAATPVWVPLTVTECQTAAGSSSPVCDTGASQQVTTNLYGANGTADNLLVHGVSVTDGTTTLVTCYGYDSLARKVSETKPMAGLTVCP